MSAVDLADWYATGVKDARDNFDDLTSGDFDARVYLTPEAIVDRVMADMSREEWLANQEGDDLAGVGEIAAWEAWREGARG